MIASKTTFVIVMDESLQIYSYQNSFIMLQFLTRTLDGSKGLFFILKYLQNLTTVLLKPVYLSYALLLPAPSLCECV